MPDYNPHIPDTVGAEWPASHDGAVQLALQVGRCALIDAAETDPVTRARLFLRTRQGNYLKSDEGLYALDVYDTADLDEAPAVLSAYSKPLAMNTTPHVSSPNWSALGAGSLWQAAADWPLSTPPWPPERSAAFAYNSPANTAGPDQASLLFKADPVFRDVHTNATVDLTGKRILNVQVEGSFGSYSPADVRAFGLWSTNGDDFSQMWESLVWPYGGLIPKQSQYVHLNLDARGANQFQGGIDIQTQDVFDMTVFGTGWFGVLLTGIPATPAGAAIPYGVYVYSLALVVTYTDEQRLATGYASAQVNPDPLWPGRWVEFPLWDPLHRRTAETWTKTAGHQYLVLARNLFFTKPGTDWRGLSSGSTVGWEDFALDGTHVKNATFLNPSEWIGLLQTQIYEPVGTVALALLLASGGGTGAPGANADITTPGGTVDLATENIVNPGPGTDTDLHHADGFDWWYYDTTVRDAIGIQALVNINEIVDERDDSDFLGAPLSAGDVWSPANLGADGTVPLHAVVADTSVHTGDGLTWSYDADDPTCVTVNILDPAAVGWETDDGGSGTHGPGAVHWCFSPEGDHWFRIIRAASVAFVADGSQPYVRPLQAHVKSGARIRWTANQMFETSRLQQDFSNVTAADDYGVISLAVHNYGGMADAEPLHVSIRLRSSGAVLAADTIDPSELQWPQWGDGKWYIVQKRLATPVTLSPGTQYYIEVSTDSATVPWQILVLDQGDATAAALGMGGVTDNAHLGNGPTAVVNKDEYDAVLRASTIPDPLTGVHATIEIVDCAHGLTGGCAVAALQRARISWAASGLGAKFDSYVIERSEDEGSTWNVIGRNTDLDAHEFVDVEMRRNVLLRYRVRQYRYDGIWSDPVEAPEEVTAELDDWVIALGTNWAPDLAVSYLDEAGYEWDPVDATRTSTRYLQGRDYGVVLRETETRGDQFSRTFIVAFDADEMTATPALGGRAAFDPLITVAHLRDAPQTAFADHRGRRWYVAARVMATNENEPGGQYLATVDMLEVVGPSPADQS